MRYFGTLRGAGGAGPSMQLLFSGALWAWLAWEGQV